MSVFRVCNCEDGVKLPFVSGKLRIQEINASLSKALEILSAELALTDCVINDSLLGRTNHQRYFFLTLNDESLGDIQKCGVISFLNFSQDFTVSQSCCVNLRVIWLNL